MPVIKAIQAETKVQQAEVLRLQDVEAEAQHILDEARQQAEAILADARTQAERLRPQAQKAGFEAGRAEGLKSGLELGRRQAFDEARADFAAQHASLAAALTAALADFEARRRSLLAELERDVVALAGAIAGRVVKRAVDVDPACVADNVREALQLIASRNRLEIHLHPQDLEHARRFAEDLVLAQQFQAVEFVADQSVGRSGVLLRTAGGRVDASVETQWMRILDEILAGWQDHWLLSPTLMPSGEPQADLPAAEPAPEAADASAMVEAVETHGMREDGPE